MLEVNHMRSDPAYRERLAACGLDTVRGVLERVEGRVAAWSRTTDTLYVSGPGDTPGFYVKRHFFPTWIKRLRGTFRGTFFGMQRGQIEYAGLNTMRALGLPAVRPVAYGVRRALHFVTACFLITEEVPEAENLTTFAQEVAAGRRHLTRTQRQKLIQELATQVAAVHATGFVHGNLFWRNVLVREGPAGKPEFFFLDVQQPHFWQCFREASPMWVRDLAQTTVSSLPFTERADRLRFLKCYLRCARMTPKTQQRAAEIEQLARQWQRHEQRRIHMNSLFGAWNRQLVSELPARDGAGVSVVEGGWQA